MLNQRLGEIFVTFSQISVFEYNTPSPFNDWTPEHVSQCFSWRRESVGFKTNSESGKFVIFASLVKEIELATESTIAIVVPFYIRQTEGIEIASITETLRFAIPPGEYDLLFQTCAPTSSSPWASFDFFPAKSFMPRVLKGDIELLQKKHFLMRATPA